MTMGRLSFPVFAVIVKGGGGQVANIYMYENGGVTSDSGLTSTPVSSGISEISHVIFCWNETRPVKCFKNETVWARGSQYSSKNWAMFVDMAVQCGTHGGDLPCNVTLQAGKGKDGRGEDAGNATIAAFDDDHVKIHVELAENYTFYYVIEKDSQGNEEEEQDDNLKVEHYDADPTYKKPIPGLFSCKESFPNGSRTGDIVVPKDKFYGIHLDVLKEIECPPLVRHNLRGLN